jgi:hypothetical protein
MIVFETILCTTGALGGLTFAFWPFLGLRRDEDR